MRSTANQANHLELLRAQEGAVHEQDFQGATNAFFGIEDENKVKKAQGLGMPSPGYSGVKRRV